MRRDSGRGCAARRHGDSVNTASTSGSRWRRYAAGLSAAAAIGGSLIATGQHVQASNSSDPAISVFPVEAPGFAGLQPLITELAAAPDGSLWFTWEIGAANSTVPATSGIGTVSSSGQVGMFGAPAGWTLIGLTVGSGFEWATETHGGAQYIGQWTPAGTLLQEFPVAAGALRGIAWGPDGNLWFAAGTSDNGCGLTGSFIGRMTTSGTVTAFPLPARTDGGNGNGNGAIDIAAGPDGALWFDLPNQASIGRITPAGTVNEFALPGAWSPCDYVSDMDLAAGPDGAMWIGSNWSGGARRVTSDGTVGTHAASGVYSITARSDGNLWYVTPFTGAAVNRMSVNGQVTGSWPLDSAYKAGSPLIIGGAAGKFWIAADGAIELLDPSVPLAVPSMSGGGGITGMGVGVPSPTAQPSPSSASTPVPGFLSFAPSPSAGAGALARAHATPSSGSGVGIVVGSVAMIVLLASGASAIVIRRRQSTARKSPPTP